MWVLEVSDLFDRKRNSILSTTFSLASHCPVLDFQTTATKVSMNALLLSQVTCIVKANPVLSVPPTCDLRTD
jgi:hypothetical protein